MPSFKVVLAVLAAVSVPSVAAADDQFVLVDGAHIHRAPEAGSASVELFGTRPLRVVGTAGEWYEVEVTHTGTGHCYDRDADIHLRGFVRASDALDVMAAEATIEVEDGTEIWVGKGRAKPRLVDDRTAWLGKKKVPVSELPTTKLYRPEPRLTVDLKPTHHVDMTTFAKLAKGLTVFVAADTPVEIVKRRDDQVLVSYALDCMAYTAWMDSKHVVDTPAEGIGGVAWDMAGERHVVRSGAPLFWKTGEPAGSAAASLEVDVESFTTVGTLRCGRLHSALTPKPTRWCFRASDVRTTKSSAPSAALSASPL